MENPNKVSQQNDVSLLGKEVGQFMEKHDLKALYVRQASHFCATDFYKFKKGS